MTALCFKTLENVCQSITYGITAAADLNTNAGPKLLRITDITENGVCWDKVPRCCVAESDEQGNSLHDGDLVVARTGGTVGKSFLISNPPRAVNASYLLRLRPDRTLIQPEYLSLFLNSSAYWSQLREVARGAAQPNVNATILSEISLQLPQLDEQRRIAARLKAQLAEVDRARQAAQAQLRDVALLRNRLLKASFVGLDAAPRKRLGDYSHITSGVTPSRDNDAYWQPAEIAWVKTGEIDFAPITEVRESISRKALVECSLSLLPPKTVLIAITGEGKTRGRSAVLEVSATTNQHSVAILPNDTWDASFLQLWLQSSYHELRELSEGRGGSRSALSGAQIKALETPVPGINEQRHIVARLKSQLDETDNMAQSVTAQLAEIERLPQRLLSQAFNNVEARP